jgi:peptidoglycan/xylan/chitin deacetylase (PgdA/CDA1 family)
MKVACECRREATLTSAGSDLRREGRRSAQSQGIVGSDFVLTIDFDAEELWLADDPSNAKRPGVLSLGAYDAKVGLGLVLRLLQEKGLRATFFVPGKVAERYPESVRQILRVGHEVGVHGYTHRSPTGLSLDEEREELHRAIAVLRELGTEPSGYRSPSWDFSENTLALLAEAGLSYSSNMMDDVHPYLHSPWDVVELPVHWILDDAPHFWFDGGCWSQRISPPSAVRELWEEEFQGIHELGGLTVLTVHPQVIGRPSRLRMLSSFLDGVLNAAGVKVATAGEIAAAFRASRAGTGGAGES